MVGGRRSRNRYGKKQQGRRWPLVVLALAAGWLTWNWIAGDDSEAAPAEPAGLSTAAGNETPATADGQPAPAVPAPVDPLHDAITAFNNDDLDKAEQALKEQLGSSDTVVAARAKLVAADIAAKRQQLDEAKKAYTALTADQGPAGALACARLADLAERAGEQGEALQGWTRAWRHPGGSDQRAEFAARAWSLAQKTLLSRSLYKGCTTYTVQPGDSLTKIARAQHTTIGLLRRVNRIDGDKIFRGNRLKVVPGPMHLEVEKHRYAMALFIGGVLVKEYQVCIGKEDRTPAATFTIQTKIEKPDWYFNGERIPYGNPKNILGTRWLGFARQDGLPEGLGIHGTTQPESIPGTGSMGCVRMRNAEVEELFGLVDRGTKVVVRE